MSATSRCTKARYLPIDCLGDPLFEMAPIDLCHSGHYRLRRSGERLLALHKLRSTAVLTQREKGLERVGVHVDVSRFRVPPKQVAPGKVRRTVYHSNHQPPDSFFYSLCQRGLCPPRNLLAQAPLSSAVTVRSCAVSRQR